MGALIVLSMSVQPTPVAQEKPSGGIPGLTGVANSRDRTIDLRTGWSRSGATRAPVPQSDSSPGSQPQPELRHSFICFGVGGGELPAPPGGWCESGVPQAGTFDCEMELVPPTWRRLVYPDGTATAWERLDEGSCGPVLPVLTVEDFRSLPIPAPVLQLQPDRGWVLINIETIVMTDPTPVQLRTTLGGFGVDVEAIPRSFTYDFGDGHSLVTRSPGRAHPDHDTFHEYEVPGTYAITLTTQWAGRYRVDGDPTWREVTGTAATSTTSAPFTAEERTSRLVGGLCTERPTPPDC
ncbi:PKD domain-containing protein [Cellulomonas phragmiteti]|uniref:PKD domain-containing protein n=1 Tax=Cellulomonas phragmiteti TaxID=478780 RepID=UPI001EF2B46C|nr:PKD domain-containing protein [Cellulomonas phragmiteti]